jgi:hypothetical protein
LFVCLTFRYDSVLKSNESVSYSVHIEEYRLLGCDAVALVRTDASEERMAATLQNCELGGSTVFPPLRWKRYVPPIRRFLQEPHGVTSQKTTLFTVTAVKT